MMLFRSAEQAAAWCTAEGRRVGAIVPLPRLRDLAESWYGDRLDPDWSPRSRDQSQAILEAAGLTSPFWRLP
ncbi:MAG: hypothetical protein QOJ25_2623 [Solirubrobacteraceae bacterium]|jgi:hypothetical protein|nr:hypothetical protein [Solirubrobacteraceae bacterium]